MTETRQSSLLRWVEPWYSAYGLDGLVLLGIAPILIPLSVQASGAGAVGLVVSAFYVGALFTPLAGSIADRTGSQRAMFLWCFPLMAVTMAGFAFSDSVWLWAATAVVFGGAGAIAGTIGGMFVVEAHPKSEWNNRISWFRLAYGAGQVLGLTLAAWATTHLRAGWLVGAAVIAAGTFLGRLGLPKLGPHATTDIGQVDPMTSVRPIGGISWILHAYHRPSLGKLRTAFFSRFGVFIVAWVLAMIGIQTFFNVVPLIMSSAFHITSAMSSIGFMVGAGLGTLVFPALGRLATAIGPGKVLALGLLLSILCFGGMALLNWTHPGWERAAAMVALVLAAVAYSFEVVSATMLTARLTPFSEGSAMGVLNSAIAAGAIIGALLPAVLAAKMGYAVLPALAAAVLIVALLVSVPLLGVGSPAQQAPG